MQLPLLLLLYYFYTLPINFESPFEKQANIPDTGIATYPALKVLENQDCSD